MSGFGKKLYDWIISCKSILQEEDVDEQVLKLCDQMSRMGFPKEWCQVAVKRTKTQTSGLDVENAIFWLLENETMLQRSHPVSIMDREFRSPDDDNASKIAQAIMKEEKDTSSKLFDVCACDYWQPFC